MVATIGQITLPDTSLKVSIGAGAFKTTAMQPCDSASSAISRDLTPLVVPPPTPANTGACATLVIAENIEGCGVKGYTANIASALLFIIIAMSVVNINDFNLFRL